MEHRTTISIPRLADVVRAACCSGIPLTCLVIVSTPAGATTRATTFGVSVTVLSNGCTIVIAAHAPPGGGLDAPPVSLTCARPTYYRLSRQASAGDSAFEERRDSADPQRPGTIARADAPDLAFLIF